MLTTGMYDCRREDGTTALLTSDYRVANNRREFDPEVVSVFWISRSETIARTNYMRVFCLASQIRTSVLGA